jgi:hypothetical protein
VEDSHELLLVPLLFLPLLTPLALLVQLLLLPQQLRLAA